MNVFTINLVLIAIWWILASFTRDRDKNFCIVVAIQIAFILAFHSFDMGGFGVQADTRRYINHYETLKQLGLAEAFVYNGLKSPLLYVMMSLCSKLNISYYWFTSIWLIISSSTIMRTIYKYSRNCLISVFVYLGMGGFVYSFYLQRQMIAITILVWAFGAFLEGKKGKTICLFLISVLVLPYTIIYLPLLILGKKPITKNIIVVYVFLFVIFLLSRKNVASLALGLYVDSAVTQSNSTLGGLAILCLFTLLLYVYLFTADNSLSTSTDTVLLHGLFISTIIQICAAFAYSFTRLNLVYFDTILLLAIPYCVDSSVLSQRFSRIFPLIGLVLKCLFLILMLALYFGRINTEGLNPYYFIWD